MARDYALFAGVRCADPQPIRAAEARRFHPSQKHEEPDAGSPQVRIRGGLAAQAVGLPDMRSLVSEMRYAVYGSQVGRKVSHVCR